MKDKLQVIALVVAFIILMAGIFWLGKTLNGGGQTTNTEIVKRDTVIVEVAVPPDTITVTRPKIVMRTLTETLYDSTIIIKYRDSAWTASDEIINSKNDTVQTDFWFPEMIFKHRFYYAKDSTKVITIFTNKTIVKERPWWELPASILGGVAVGYGLGRL